MTRPNDRVYSHVTLIDGSGAAGRAADVAVLDDQISAIGAAGTLTGEHHVDGSGLVLAPGFIDIHSHADAPVLIDGRAHSAVTQGVTTIVTGNCGFGLAPFPERSDVSQADMSPGVSLRDLAGAGDVSTFPAYLDALRRRGVGVNVLPLVAHGVLRAAIAGFEQRALTHQEILAMTAMTSDAVDAGAVGVSSGLEYAPGIAATTAELAAIAVPVGRAGGIYATHCRNRSERIVEAAQEGIFIAESSGARLQMSHFIRRPTGPDPSMARQAMDVIREARHRGVNARCDVFPFEYGPSPMTMFVPQHFREEAGVDFGSMLGDTDFVGRIVADLDPRFVAMLDRGIAADMFVSSDGQDGRYVGLTLGQVATAKGVPVAHAAIQMLAEAGAAYGAVIINERWTDWGDLLEAISDPDFILMGDGSMANLDGPLAGRGFALSDWGWATATLGRFVRDLAALTLEDAIHRMTALPAAQIGLERRGQIKVGWAADLVLLDPHLVSAHVTPEQTVATSTGIREVVVNGVAVVTAGVPTNATPGLVGMHDINH